MSKKKSLSVSMEWNGKTLYIYGYIPSEELKKIADDFENGIEVKHEQVEVVDGEFVSPRLLAMVGREKRLLAIRYSLFAETVLRKEEMKNEK